MGVCLSLAFALLLAAHSAESYKIAIFTPNVAGSQILFGFRVGETLAEAGHDVTVVLLNIKSGEEQRKYSDIVKVMPVDMYSFSETEVHQIQAKFVFKEMGLSSLRKFLKLVGQGLRDSCEALVRNREFLERLRAEKFDVVFTHMFDLCTAGVAKHLGIDGWIWLNSGQMMDYVAYYVGVPSPPSYVPPLVSALPDDMNFIQRVKSFVGRSLLVPIFEYGIVNPQTEIFRKYVNASFPDLREVARKCPLVMANSNPMYSQARPTLHKVVYIGGVGMKFSAAKPLQGEFKEIVDNTENVVVMTFGSHANLSSMPDSWKEAFMNSFKKFPDHAFVIRYEAHDWDQRKPSNVHFSSWIPQNDLLQNSKTRLLITHGGFNSVQEAIHSSTPLVVVPLFGDQFTNARLVTSSGIGRALVKSAINEATVTECLEDVLHSDRYTKAVERLHRMIEKQPDSAEKLLVKWTEFVAEFQALENLVPHGINLSFVEYFCLDVIAVLLAVLATVLYIFFAISRCVVRRVCRFVRGANKDKKKRE